MISRSAVTGSTEPEICTKMLKNLSEKLRTKFRSTTLGYSVVRISRLDNAFSEFLELQASPDEGQQMQQEDKKGEKRRGEIINLVPRAHFSFGQERHQEHELWPVPI